MTSTSTSTDTMSSEAKTFEVTSSSEDVKIGQIAVRITALVIGGDEPSYKVQVAGSNINQLFDSKAAAATAAMARVYQMFVTVQEKYGALFMRDDDEACEINTPAMQALVGQDAKTLTFEVRVNGSVVMASLPDLASAMKVLRVLVWQEAKLRCQEASIKFGVMGGVIVPKVKTEGAKKAVAAATALNPKKAPNKARPTTPLSDVATVKLASKGVVDTLGKRICQGCLDLGWDVADEPDNEVEKSSEAVVAFLISVRVGEFKSHKCEALTDPEGVCYCRGNHLS